MSQQLLLDFVSCLAPSLVVLCIYIFHQTFHMLPEKQRELLEKLAKPAVQSVEQMYTNATNDQKKYAALHVIELGFEAFGRTMPDDAIVNAFVESAVYELNKLSEKKVEQQATAKLPSVQKSNTT